MSLFGVTREQLIGWMATGSAQYDTPGTLTLDIDTDGTVESFLIWNLIVADDGESWIAANAYLSLPRIEDWMARFVAAHEITVSTPFVSVALAARAEDQANRAAFVEACRER